MFSLFGEFGEVDSIFMIYFVGFDDYLCKLSGKLVCVGLEIV